MFYPYLIVPVITMLIASGMLIYTLAINHKSPVNRAFALLAGLIFMWQFQHLIFWSPYGLINPDFCIRFFSLFYFYAGFGFLNFVYNYINRKKDWLYCLFFTSPIISYVLVWTTDLIQRGYYIFDWGIQGEWGPLFILAITVNVFFPIVLGLVLLFKEYHANKNKVLQKQIQIMIIGGGVAASTGYFVTIFLRFALEINHLPDFSNEMGLVFILFVFYAVIKYRFLAMDVSTVAHDLFSHVNDGILILNQNQQIMHINGAAKEIFKIKSITEEQKISVLLPEQDFTKPLLNQEIVILDKFLLLSNYFLFEQGTFRGTIVFLKDISDVKKAEKERTELHKKMMHTNQLSSIGVLASGVAHELNNPLTAILGFSKQIKKMIPSESEAIDKIEKIEKAGTRMAKIIEQLKKISRDTSADSFRTVNLQTIIDDSTLLLKKQLETNNISLKISMPQNELLFLGNEIQLESVFQNLLTNSKDAFACSHSPLTSKEILIDVKQQADKIIIDYKDNAGGFSDEVAEKIFLPFYTTKEVGKGTGLGMTIIKETLEAHNGSIDIIGHHGGVHFQLVIPLSNM